MNNIAAINIFFHLTAVKLGSGGEERRVLPTARIPQTLLPWKGGQWLSGFGPHLPPGKLHNLPELSRRWQEARLGFHPCSPINASAHPAAI